MFLSKKYLLTKQMVRKCEELFVEAAGFLLYLNAWMNEI